MNTGKVTRVEVIDHNGRSYVFDPLQDDGRTLKVFVDCVPKIRACPPVGHSIRKD